MARPAAKARPPKHLVALAVVAVLGLVLVVDFLWASSTSSAWSSAAWSSRLNLSTSPAVEAPPVAKEVRTPSPLSRPMLRDARLPPLLRLERPVFCVSG